MIKYCKYYVSNDVIYSYETLNSGWNVLYCIHKQIETISKSTDLLTKKQFMEIIREHRKGIRK